MDDPAKEKEPENGRQDELDDGDEQTPLKQLPQSGNEKLHSAAMTFPADPCPAKWPPQRSRVTQRKRSCCMT